MKFLPFLFLICACAPSTKLKRAERLIKKAIAQGAKVDSTSTTKVEYVNVPGQVIEVEKIVPGPVDTLRLKEPCAEVLKKPTPRAVRRLQEVACPTLEVDTAYTVTLQAGGFNYRLPVRVQIEKGYRVAVGPLKVPVIKEEINVDVSAGYTAWGLAWRLGVAVIVGAIAGFILGKVLKWAPF